MEEECIRVVSAARRGDKEALLSLIMAEKSQYFRLAYSFLNHEEDAMDALEDMIVILYQKIPSLRQEELFFSWSKTILVNCCKKRLKQRKKLIPTEEPFLATGNSGKEASKASEVEDRLALEQHLSGLSEKHSEILKLKYYMDYDNSTIAKILKIPIGTVKSRISKGLTKLRESLGGDFC